MKATIELSAGLEKDLGFTAEDTIEIKMSTRPGGGSKMSWNDLDQEDRKSYLENREDDIIYDLKGKPKMVMEFPSYRNTLILKMQDVRAEDLYLSFANECKVRLQDKFLRKGFILDGQGNRTKGKTEDFLSENEEISINACDLFKSFSSPGGRTQSKAKTAAGAINFLMDIAGKPDADALFDEFIKSLDEKDRSGMRQAFALFKAQALAANGGLK